MKKGFIHIIPKVLLVVVLGLFLQSANAQTEGAGKSYADVIGVAAKGTPGEYIFQVTVKSPDTGCEKYADWWEVVSVEGDLIYRRILLHSHVDEQPFTRTGGEINIEKNTQVIVRAHMNTGGYGGKVWQGSVASGFREVTPRQGFAADLEKLAPQPEGCSF